jgi:predicted flap endonuclease-1-like 5' DNA nuclease
VRVYAPYDNVHLPTVSDLWGGVDWHEREAYDLVGLHFDGHHDHRRILLEDHWTIHPLQRKYNTRGYLIPGWTAKPWPSPAPWEEGFTPFGAAAAPAAHAPAAKPAAAPATSSPAAPIGETAPSAPASSTAPAAPSAAPVVDAPSSEPPKKVAKKWVPKGAAAETPSAPSSDEKAVIAASVAEAAPSVAAEVNPATPPVAPASSPDDLHRIEGIGPKMDAALQAAGITTFAKLAASSEQDIRTAIEAAGLSFAPSMTSWAEQAGFLARGDEAGFKALTDRLTAGRGAETAAPPSETPATEPSSETPATEEKPRSPKIKRWNPNG